MSECTTPHWYLKYSEDHLKLFAPRPKPWTQQYAVFQALWETSDDHKATTEEIATMFAAEDHPEGIAPVKKRRGRTDISAFRARVRNVMYAGYVVEVGKDLWQIAPREHYEVQHKKYLKKNVDYNRGKAAGKKMAGEDRAIFLQERRMGFEEGRFYVRTKLLEAGTVVFCAFVGASAATVLVLNIWGYFS
jgi:hypothetical protein